MKRIFLHAICLVFLMQGYSAYALKTKVDQTPKETIVLITTNVGQIKLKLYNQTPKHRDNFIKLVNNHFYDSTLFHRVIQGFMIQGGDPESKRAIEKAMLGNGETGYTIPAEFNPELFHKKGALAAARQGDEVNPNRESSGCQFYIVQGKPLTNSDLDSYEARINNNAKQKLFGEIMNRAENKGIKDKFISFQKEHNTDSLQALSKVIEPMIDKEMKILFKFGPEQRAAYTTIGGTPHLDGAYTVFGEVLEGLDIVEKIAAVPVDQASRPLTNVRIMKVEMVN